MDLGFAFGFAVVVFVGFVSFFLFSICSQISILY